MGCVPWNQCATGTAEFAKTAFENNKGCSFFLNVVQSDISVNFECSHVRLSVGLVSSSLVHILFCLWVWKSEMDSCATVCDRDSFSS